MMECLIQPVEHSCQREARAHFRWNIEIEILVTLREQLIEPRSIAQSSQRAARRQHGQRYERGAGPLCEMVDVEREPWRKPDDFRRQIGCVPPGPDSNHCEPVARKDTYVMQAAVAQNPFPCAAQYGRALIVPGRPQRRIDFHSRIDISLWSSRIDVPR